MHLVEVKRLTVRRSRSAAVIGSSHPDLRTSESRACARKNAHTR